MFILTAPVTLHHCTASISNGFQYFLSICSKLALLHIFGFNLLVLCGDVKEHFIFFQEFFLQRFSSKSIKLRDFKCKKYTFSQDCEHLDVLISRISLLTT